jgi:hypothetical protein
VPGAGASAARSAVSPGTAGPWERLREAGKGQIAPAAFPARLGEIGGRFISAPSEEVFHIEDLDYRNPDMLIFGSKDGNGRPVELLQLIRSSAFCSA